MLKDTIELKDLGNLPLELRLKLQLNKKQIGQWIDMVFKMQSVKPKDIEEELCKEFQIENKLAHRAALYLSKGEDTNKLTLLAQFSQMIGNYEVYNSENEIEYSKKCKDALGPKHNQILAKLK
jgi:hypothetical protein